MLQLRDYQENIANRAAGILSAHGIALLLMQVRTGKTLTALRACEIMCYNNVLFVTKKKAISSIENDFKNGGFSYKINITNYENLNKLLPCYDCVVYDEFHSLGAFPVASGRTKEAKRLSVNSHVIMLSGTPTPESWSQLYHPLWASGRGSWTQYKNFYAWAKDYVRVKAMYIYNRQINDYSDADIDRIQKDIDPYVIRFTQEDAGFSTVVEDRLLFIDMPNSVDASLKLLKRNKIFITSSKGTVLGDTAVKLMMKCHQLSSGTVKTEEGEYIAFSDFKARFIEKEFEGKKIAIFYKYIAERTHIENVFGDMIVNTPEEFNGSGSDKIYVTQIQSGSMGINLSSADYLVMYNIDFSALSYWQSRERLQSQKRDRPAVVCWLMTRGGIEEAIYNVVQGKKDFTARHFNK